MKKCVNGTMMEMTQEELAELEKFKLPEDPAFTIEKRVGIMEEKTTEIQELLDILLTGAVRDE